MKAVSLIKLSLLENFKSQLLWVSVITNGLCLLFIYIISDLGMSQQDRLIDTFSYFLADISLVIVSIFLGSFVFSHDFSSTGIAEIAIPSGINRKNLLFWRMLGHALSILFLSLVLFLSRYFLFYITSATEIANYYISSYMFLFSTLKAILVLNISIFFSILVRPVIALLSSLAFLVAGHFSAGISGLQGLQTDSNLVSPLTNFLMKFFKIWNPNYLVIESLASKWEDINLYDVLWRLGWGFLSIVFFSLISFLIIDKKDIESLK